MDVPRTRPPRRRRRVLLAAALLAALALATAGLASLDPAVPSAERSGLWIDTVRRGPMVREVRGSGTLVPLEVRWIVAPSEGHVERLGAEPGAAVEPGSVLVELRSPELETTALDAELELRAAEADAIGYRADLEHALIEQRAAAARAAADLSQARLEADANAKLARDGLVSGLANEISQVRAGELQTRDALERERLASAERTLAAKLAANAARIDQLRGLARLRRAQADALRVVAGMRGVLQVLPVQPGQRVEAGAVLARVADPARLKVELKIPETQAKDVAAGQRATIDTRNGTAPGRVVRVDPAVQNGTVTVDLVFDGAPPAGVRPDLSVDGVIEIERLADVLFVGRPAFVTPEGPVGLFRLAEGGTRARRVAVRLGRTSVNVVEVVEGLAAGDRVILSDTSQWDDHDEIRLH